MDQDLTYECTGVGNGNAWVAPEVTAVDACEGPVPVHRYNTGDDDQDGVPGMIDPDDFGPGPTTEIEGLYYAQYVAWDTSDNVQSAILAVNVRDTLKPVLTLNGMGEVQTQCYTPTHDPTEPGSDVAVDPDPYVEQGVTATDQCYGDLTSQVRIAGQINKQVPGVYTLEYQAQDSALNQADPIIRNVEVIDTLAPKVVQSPPIQVSAPPGSMLPIQVSQCAIAWDLCDGYMDINTHVSGLTVTSNDPGHDANDIEILDSSTFAVRDMLNTDGSERVYTAYFTVVDSSYNATKGMCTLYVPSP